MNSAIDEKLEAKALVLNIELDSYLHRTVSLRKFVLMLPNATKFILFESYYIHVICT